MKRGRFLLEKTIRLIVLGGTVAFFGSMLFFTTYILFDEPIRPNHHDSPWMLVAPAIIFGLLLIAGTASTIADWRIVPLKTFGNRFPIYLAFGLIVYLIVHLVWIAIEWG